MPAPVPPGEAGTWGPAALAGAALYVALFAAALLLVWGLVRGGPGAEGEAP